MFAFVMIVRLLILAALILATRHFGWTVAGVILGLVAGLHGLVTVSAALQGPDTLGIRPSRRGGRR